VVQTDAAPDVDPHLVAAGFRSLLDGGKPFATEVDTGPRRSECSDPLMLRPHIAGNTIAGHRTRTAHIGSAESRCRADNHHSVSAQVLRPIIASATRQSNTVGCRVMRCLLDWPTRNTSPDIGRLGSRSSYSLSGGSEAHIDRSDVPNWCRSVTSRR
jgi:hypothetical protein